MEATRTIRPQPGPQWNFLACRADIAIYGGSAGSGKSFALLLGASRHVAKRDYRALILRRTTPELRAPGALWDETHELYPSMSGTPRQSPLLEWQWPSGATVQFNHLEHDKSLLKYHGAQLGFIGFDELTTFTAHQFWYLQARLRSKAGIKARIRATTNPDADSWVAKLIEWWIDPETGYPIPERASVLRYFVRVGDELLWADDPAELSEHLDPEGEPLPPRSLTFVPAKLEDNQILMEKSPEYRAILLSMRAVERERFLHGNWLIRPAAGDYFKRAWVEPLEDAVPIRDVEWVRGWDLASTEPLPGRDPDWTVGILLGRSPDGRYWLADAVYDRLSPGKVEKLIIETAIEDRRTRGQVRIALPQDPGAGGKLTAAYMVRLLAGFDVRYRPVTGNKVQRFSPFSAQAEASNVSAARGSWNDYVFRELENFPPGNGRGHDDVADAVSLAFDFLTRRAPRPAVGRYAMH